MNDRWGMVFGREGIESHKFFNSKEFMDREVMECKDDNLKISKIFSKPPTGMIEMRWCETCLIKNVEAIPNEPYFQQCYIKADKDTIDHIYQIYKPHTKWRIKKTPPEAFTGI